MYKYSELIWINYNDLNFEYSFATRAMKIQNKPVVNEVTSNALEIRELKIRIDLLEKKLNEQKRRFQGNESIKKDSKYLRNGISKISTPNVSPTKEENAQKRESNKSDKQSSRSASIQNTSSSKTLINKGKSMNSCYIFIYIFL